MTIVSPSRALWVWPWMTALVFGGTAALISAQAEAAEIFARVLAATGVGLALSFAALLLAALLRPRAGARGGRPQANAAGVKSDAS